MHCNVKVRLPSRHCRRITDFMTVWNRWVFFPGFLLPLPAAETNSQALLYTVALAMGRQLSGLERRLLKRPMMISLGKDLTQQRTQPAPPPPPPPPPFNVLLRKANSPFHLFSFSFTPSCPTHTLTCACNTPCVSHYGQLYSLSRALSLATSFVCMCVCTCVCILLQKLNLATQTKVPQLAHVAAGGGGRRGGLEAVRGDSTSFWVNTL